MSRFRRFLARKAPYLTDEDCALFSPCLRRESIPRKGFFLAAGQVCRSMGFVLSGSFRVFREADGKEISTHFILPEGFAVEYGSFLDQVPSAFAIQALEDAELIAFGQVDLRKAYERSHAWDRFGRTMAEAAFSAFRRRAESFQSMDGEARYLRALEEEPELFRHVPLYHVASYLGMEKESLSRIRRRLAQRPSAESRVRGRK